MIIQQLFPFLLLLASGCSAQQLILALQSAAQSADSTTETSITPLSPSIKYAEQSSQEVAHAGLGNAMNSLDIYKWKNRLLLVFAPSGESAAYEKQMQLLEGQNAGLEDRDLLIVKLLAEGTNHLDSQLIDETTAAQLRSQFNVGQEEFCIILLGKDGTQKRRDEAPVEPAVIFHQIDAMPMRQQEMHSKQRQE